MKAEESKLTSVFVDSKIYCIPRYQRPYSWNEANAYDLINDTYEAFENKESEYFIGSIITIENEKDALYDVVDGQQRLTTLTILFSKLRDLIENDAAKNELQKRILPINVFTDAPESPRLQVRKQDQSFFKKHILLGEKCSDLTDLSETQRRFLCNLNIIEEFLLSKDQSELKMYANYLLGNVYVVSVKTENFTSAYRLFNVLNARGMPLSNSDLIKNKLFDANKVPQFHDYIEEKWNELEDMIGISNMDVFLGHHRTCLIGEKQRSNLTKEYERIIERSKSPSIFLDDLIKSARNYKRIIHDEKSFSNITRRLLKSLRNVSHDEWIPALLAYINNPIEDLGLETYISFLEKITYQNWIRRLGKTHRNTVYYNIIGLINKHSSGEDITNKIKEFKNNTEFLDFINGDLYGTQYATAILLKIEEMRVDYSVSKQYAGSISVEHILPQSLVNNYWSSRFTMEEHKTWVHKIGNLTLLSGRKNSAAQNYDFFRKKDIYEKYQRKCSFDLTKEICECENWDLEALRNRQKELIEEIKVYWFIE